MLCYSLASFPCPFGMRWVEQGRPVGARRFTAVSREVIGAPLQPRPASMAAMAQRSKAWPGRGYSSSGRGAARRGEKRVVIVSLIVVRDGDRPRRAAIHAPAREKHTSGMAHRLGPQYGGISTLRSPGSHGPGESLRHQSPSAQRGGEWRGSP